MSKTGIILLITSFIMGYGIVGICMLLYIYSGYSFWLWVSSVIYVFSWCIFGLGFLLSGKEGLKIIKKKF